MPRNIEGLPLPEDESSQNTSDSEKPWYQQNQEEETRVKGSAERGRKFLEKKLEIQQDAASEQEKLTAEGISLKLRTVLYDLLERTKDNPQTREKLVLAITGFVDALESQVIFGAPPSEEQWNDTGRGKEVADFLEEASKALKYKVSYGGTGSLGKRPKLDFSKWED